MNAELLKKVMEMADKIGAVTKVSAFDTNIYIDGELPDGKLFHLTVNFVEKEGNEDVNTL